MDDDGAVARGGPAVFAAGVRGDIMKEAPRVCRSGAEQTVPHARHRKMTRLVDRRISVSPTELDEFCRRNHVTRLAFFGSVLRDDFRPESDIDVLVEFEPDYVIGYLGLARMQIELSSLLGREVDLRTPEELSRYFRDEVVRNAEVRFAA